jgi:aspartate-semialdehyde dehydrogenase
MDSKVPLVIPEVNGSHLDMLEETRSAFGGAIVTNPNCSVIGLAIAMAPIHRVFGIRKAFVATLQALSGAGLDGPLGLQMMDNVIPYIPGEEEKIEKETTKILGDGKEPARIAISAHCHRVPTTDGHMESVSLELAEPATVDQVIDVLRQFRGETEDIALPSAPDAPIVVRAEADRPQPALDRHAGRGMSVVVGRVRPCPILTIKLELLSHNTMRGAAGAALLNAELMAARGYLAGGRRK